MTKAAKKHWFWAWTVLSTIHKSRADDPTAPVKCGRTASSFEPAMSTRLYAKHRRSGSPRPETRVARCAWTESQLSASSWGFRHSGLSTSLYATEQKSAGRSNDANRRLHSRCRQPRRSCCHRHTKSLATFSTVRHSAAAPNHALQRTEAGVQLIYAILVPPRQPLSLSLEALGSA